MLTYSDCAFFIFRKKQVRQLGVTALSQANRTIQTHGWLAEREQVCFLIDIFNQVMGKVYERKMLAYRYNLRPDGKPFQAFKFLLKEIKKHQINPAAFLEFAVARRKASKIPPVVYNICVPKNVEMFLAYRKQNSYRVSSFTKTKSWLDRVRNYFAIDLRTFVTLQLRKPLSCIQQEDHFAFSEYSAAMLAHARVSSFVSGETNQFSEDLQFDDSLKREVFSLWNSAVDAQLGKVSLLVNAYSADYYRQRVAGLISILEGFKL